MCRVLIDPSSAASRPGRCPLPWSASSSRWAARGCGPSGAIYWLPGHRLDEWARIALAVENAADGALSAVYVLRHRLDHDAVRAVRDAVVAEVQAEATRIRDDVLAGELGGRALETRQQQAADLRSKVLLYEELLNVGLKGLHRAIDEADQAAATAAILLGATTPEYAGAAFG